MKRPLIIIAGTTATGKSDVSVKLAKRIGGQIVSADSMQVYRGMDIGTAKMTPQEMDGVKHYLIDVLNPDDEFNIAIFQAMAKDAIENIYKDGDIPILAGGTGFYIQSILYDIDFKSEPESESDEVRKRYEQMMEEYGPEKLHDMLSEVDPESAEAIHMNNKKRVIRALEYYEIHNEPISKHNVEQHMRKSPYEFKFFVLERDRSLLYEAIDKRVDKMIGNGLETEVRKLADEGYDRKLVSMQGIGYKEMLDYIHGDCSLDDAIYKIKLNTRHFAKRQITWFKREPDTIAVNVDSYDTDLDKVCDYLYDETKYMMNL